MKEKNYLKKDLSRIIVLIIIILGIYILLFFQDQKNNILQKLIERII